MRKSLVTMAYVLCFSLVVGIMVLEVPSAVSGIGVTVDIYPKTLNLKSNGTWITAYIEFSADYNVSEINVTTVFLDDTIRAESKPWEIGDYDEDDVSDMMVKFDRRAVIDHLLSKLYHMAPPPAKNYVELTITGERFDGTPFEGDDTIRVIYKG